MYSLKVYFTIAYMSTESTGNNSSDLMNIIDK